MQRQFRKYFGVLLCGGMAIALFLFPSSNVANSPPPATTEIRGVWLTNVGSGVLFAPWGIHRAMYQLAEQNFNTVYPVVWNRGNTFYHSAVAKKETGKTHHPVLALTHFGSDVLTEVLNQAHRQQLRVIPWFEYGLMIPAASKVATLHPQWLTEPRMGGKINSEILHELNGNDATPSNWRSLWQNLGQFLSPNNVWLNPLHPDVQEFILDLIVEVVTEYDIDGIQLDDHFGMPVELGYDLFTVKLYQQEHNGMSPPDNPRDSEWMRWRSERLSNFMGKIYNAVKSVKPDCAISLSPNSHDFAYRNYLQDWLTWVQRGWVDELLVQVYRHDLSSFEAELSEPALAIARQQIPVGVGILTGTWGTPVRMEQIKRQVQIVRDRGFDGISFFYWESLWSYLTPESPQERRNEFRQLLGEQTR